MASQFETGHSKNVAKFEDIVYIISEYGQTYNPSNPKLQLSELQNLQNQAEQSINTMNSAMPVYKNAVAKRQIAFEGLSSKVTRIKNALEVSGAPSQSIAQATSLIKKVRGGGSISKPQAENSEEEAKTISTSQMSYDNRLSNYTSLVKFLATIQEYRPNEQELQIQSLENEINQLKEHNKAVMKAEVQLSNIRTERNDLFYGDDDGIYDRVSSAKTYVKSVYGSKSPQYKQISKVKLTNHK